MSNSKLQITLSHAILAGTGIYCLYQVKNKDLLCPKISYGLFAINNIIALFCWERDYNTKLLELYKLTAYCQLLFALPCINTMVWLQNGYSKDWSWAWSIVPLFPLLCYIINADLDMPLVDLLILFNLVGLSAVSFLKELNYGIAASLAYAFAHYFIRNMTMYNLGLTFFAYLSLRAIGFGHDLFN